ncbi:MAG TPA: amino acid adenylation domain-containing protein, partial [Pseudomonadales bacterium]|nr:amino acid adenylation domain-containing protein [Pseudomonadales bacterium]
SKTQAEQYVKTFVFRPYDLSGNLLRFQLLQNRTGAYLLIAAHHALMDGMGVASLVASVLDVYHALKDSRDFTLPDEFFPQYLPKERDSTDTPEAIRYWQDKLQNTAGLSQYRSSHVPRVEQATVARNFLTLDASHYSAIKHYCRAQRMTPALYFKGLFGLLIELYCRPDNDFCLYEISSGLLNIRLNAAGCSVQRRPFVFERKHLQGEQTLADYFHRLREEQSAIHKAGLHTSIMTQKYLVPEGRVNFMYNYYHFTREFEVAGHSYETLLYPNDVEQVHLVVNFKQGQLELALHYPAGLFEPLHFLERLELLSQQIVSGDASCIKQLNYVLQSERSLLATAFSGKTKTVDTLPLMAAQCASSLSRHASRIAVKQGETCLTFADLDLAANQLASVLKAEGVTANSRVAVCLSRSPELMIALLAIVKTGAAYVPVDSAYPQERIRYIVSDAAATVLLSHSALRDRLPELTQRCLWLDQIPAEPSATAVWPAKSALDDLFYVIYTSGSTGQPKGASVKQRGVINLLDWYIDEFDLQHIQKHLIISAFGFDLTQKNLWSALLTGGTLYFPLDDHYHPPHLLEQIDSEGIEIINCAPSALYGLIDACEGDFKALSSLRYVILGGEPIVLDRIRPWLSDAGCAAQIVNNYGPTECTDIAAFYRLTDIHRHSVPIGRPNTNVKLHLVNDNGQAVPPGIMGELCISGAGVGAGYLNKPELNARAFQPIFENHVPDSAAASHAAQWYRSGDLMCLSPEGELEFVGRKDFQVKLRGLRIELPEIEAALRAQNGVEDCLVLVERPLGEQKESTTSQLEHLIAYVVGPDSLNETPWSQRLGLSLPAYMLPSQVIVLSQWPLTPNGKIDRSALPKAEEVNATPFVAPRNDIEQQLVQIWSEVLGLSKVSVLDNFFAVGGNSLLAVRIIARMEKHFGHTFALSMLFSAQTIAELAQRVNRHINPHSWTPLIEIKAAQLSEGESAAPPLFFIHPVGGTVWCYQPLAAALHQRNPKRAIYGLQSSGLDAEQALLHNFETMAALYAEAIRAVQPQGPYYLLGQSMGGNIAWELAQQLQAQGQDVAWVVLIDSFVPQHIPDFFRQQDTVSLLFSQFGQVLQVDWLAMKQQNLEEQIRTFYEAARAQGLLSQDLGFEQVRRLALVMKSNAEALLAYQARTYSGRVLHVRASDNSIGDASLGWAELVRGELVQHSLPASHDGILQAPHAEALAALLLPYLAYQRS